MKLAAVLFILILGPVLLAQNDTVKSSTEILSDSLLLEGVDARFVIERYIEAIGGRKNLIAVGNRTTQMTGSVQGFDVKMTIYQKKPNKLRQQIEASGLDQVIIFDGENGIMKLGEDKQNIIGDELNKLKYEASMDLILNADSAGLNMELVGTRTIGNIRTYMINNKIEGLFWSSYYSIENGLKVLEEKQIKTASGTFMQEVYYKDYKEVEGVKYPFKVEQKLGPQELKFNVNSIKINQALEDSLFEIN